MDTPHPSADGQAAAWRRPMLVLAPLALAVSLAGFGWTLNGHFLGDDFGYVGRFHDYPFAQWPRLFVESWAGPIWGFQLRELRPMTALSFMSDARMWGDNAFGFRLTNLLLHAGCAAMVGLAAWRAAGRDLACGMAALVLFALHPAHAEPVQWITGRVDVLTTMFYLAGFLAFLRYRSRASRAGAFVVAAIYACAAFGKEFGLTLPIMCLLADVFWLQTWRHWREGRTWWPYLGCVVVVTIYFFCRRAAFGSDGVGAPAPDWLSAEFQKQFGQRQLTYLGHLFPPFERWLQEGTPLYKDHAIRTFGWIAGGVIAGFAAWRWGGRHRPAEERRAALFFGLGWYLAATLPLIVTYISPRHLYLASTGLCVAVALLLRGLLRVRWIFGVAVIALATLYAQRLSVTMKPWHDAAVVSGQIARELRALEPKIKDGGGLFLDVPEIRAGGAYVWTWAIPFALRPPFTHGKLGERAIVLESRGLYVNWEHWHEQPAIAALQKVETESWILQMIDDKPARHIPVPPEKVRAAVAHFAAAPLKDDPHGSWRKMINEMTVP